MSNGEQLENCDRPEDEMIHFELDLGFAIASQCL